MHLLMYRIESDKEIEQLTKNHIDRLHRYNDVKDLAQAIIGRIAVIEGVTTKELYPRFDLDLNLDL